MLIEKAIIIQLQKQKWTLNLPFSNMGKNSLRKDNSVLVYWTTVVVSQDSRGMK